MSALMSSMDLWVWPTIALVIFLSVFAGVAISVFRATTQECDHNANIPLLDGSEPAHAASHGTNPALAPSQKGEAR